MKTWHHALSTADAAPKTAPILLTGSVQENLAKAKELGYEAIEVHTRPDVVWDYEAINEQMARDEMRIAAIITGRLNTESKCSLIDDRPYVVEAAMKGMYQYIDMAQKLHSNIVLGWVKGNVPPHGNRETYLARLAHNLRPLAEYAGEREVKIFAEVINRYEVNIFTNAAETMQFIMEWNLENVYVHLDTFHMNIEETNPYDAIRLCKGKLGYFHIADNTRSYPGSGQICFAPILKTLEEIGYDGYLSVECLPGEDNEETARKALRRLKGIEQKY